MFKSGFVAIIGKPNVGKSTILNFLLGYDLAIISRKPETTRNNILGTLTTKEGQINFLDTPGIHTPHTLLGKYMVRQAQSALMEVDLILAVTDMKFEIDKDDKRMFELLQKEKKSMILLINKIDRVDKRLILPLIDECKSMDYFKEYIPISAKNGDNMDVLIPKMLQYLPEGPKHYPDDHLTDKPVRFLVGEFIRQQVLSLTHEEIPHSVAVCVEEIKKRPKKKLHYVQATIFVERDSQKAIIIGKNGQLLKEIGEAARKNIEEELQTKVYLDLWVKVYKNWRKDPRALNMLGYT